MQFPVLTAVSLCLLAFCILLLFFLLRRKAPGYAYIIMAAALLLCAVLAVSVFSAPRSDGSDAEAQTGKTRHVMLEGLYPPITLEDAAEQAYAIVYGQIDPLTQTRLITDYPPDGAQPASECYTLRMIHISEAVKNGDANASSKAVLFLPGGETDTDIYIADYAPAVDPGDFVVAFLDQSGNPIRPQYVFVEKDGKVYVPAGPGGEQWAWVETDAFLSGIRGILENR